MTNLSFDRYLHTLPIGEVAPSVNDALRRWLSPHLLERENRPCSR